MSARRYARLQVTHWNSRGTFNVDYARNVWIHIDVVALDEDATDPYVSDRTIVPLHEANVSASLAAHATVTPDSPPTMVTYGGGIDYKCKGGDPDEAIAQGKYALAVRTRIQRISDTEGYAGDVVETLSRTVRALKVDGICVQSDGPTSSYHDIVRTYAHGRARSHNAIVNMLYQWARKLTERAA